MKATILKAGLLALAMGASAAHAAGFNYNYIEGGFGELDGDGDAFFVGGAMDIDKSWGIIGRVQRGNYDVPFSDADQTLIEAGAQYHMPLKSNLSLNAGLQLLYAKYDVGACRGFRGFSCSNDDIGLVGNVGLRFQVAPQFQLEGDAKLLVNDALNDGLGLQGDARYYFTPKLSGAAGLAIDTELDGIFVAVRYDM